MDMGEREVLGHVDGWDMEASVSLESSQLVTAAPLPPSRSSASASTSTSETGPSQDVEIFELAEPEEVWRMVEAAITKKEQAECRQKLMNDLQSLAPAGRAGRAPVQIRDFSLKNIVYKETRYRVVYVPVYFLRYGIGDGSQYAFYVNAQTGAVFGQRPYGAGALLGRPLQFFERVLGIKDVDEPKIITGKALRLWDSKPCYKENGLYVVFPSSHSYLFAYARGSITLKNTSRDFAIQLASQRRETNKVEAQFVLGPGQVQSFAYRGNWCIEVVGPVDAGTRGGMIMGLDLGTVAHALEVVEVKSEGGREEDDLLKMAA
jgi:hypothetical protein